MVDDDDKNVKDGGEIIMTPVKVVINDDHGDDKNE